MLQIHPVLLPVTLQELGLGAVKMLSHSLLMDRAEIGGAVDPVICGQRGAAGAFLSVPP